MKQIVSWSMVSILCTATLAAAATTSPVAVSPGDGSRLALVEARCPTFSWGSVDGAKSYELVVYKVAEESREAESVLNQHIPGSALSWTPSLDRCLEPGGKYAWSVRAVGRKGATEWSAPSLFEVASGASEVEFERALAVVRDYLATRDGAEVGGVVAARGSAESMQKELEAASLPETPAVGTTQLTVDGGVVAGSFTGDGSTLTGLDPTNLAPGTAAIDISGTSAVATTATALAADGTNCAAGEFAAGVDAAGTAQGCAAPPTNAETVDGFDASATASANTLLALDGSGKLPADITGNAATTTLATTATALAADGANCAADEAAAGVDASGNAQDCRDQTDLTAFATNNTRVGNGALAANTTGNGNTASGRLALSSNTTGRYNTASGSLTLFYNTTGSSNTASGDSALAANSTGNFNTASGRYALFFNTTGRYNTASGYKALRTNSTGWSSTAIGFRALRDSTASRNTAIGSRALERNTTGFRNTASGSSTLFHNTTGGDNTASGYKALAYNTEGYLNTAVGRNALFLNLTGSRNTAVGYSAGRNSRTGSDNIFIGIGARGINTDSNTIRIGGDTVGTDPGQQNRTFINGIWGVAVGGSVPVLVNTGGQLGTISSSRRYKEKIEQMGERSSALLDLRPVTFQFKEREYLDEGQVEYGLIAEEVAEVFPDLVVYDAEGRPETVKYHLLSSILLNEFQRQHRRVQVQGWLLGLILLSGVGVTLGRWQLG